MMGKLFCAALLLLAAVGPASAADKDGSYKLNLDKSGHTRRIFVPVRVQSVLKPVEGTLVGQPFKLKAAKATANGVLLTDGKLEIAIEFPQPQNFSNQTFQIRYNTTKALIEGGAVAAPKVTYTTIDGSGAATNVTATNGSKEDKLDYAMELKFYPGNKKGEKHGYVRLQIGSQPVSEVKGDFFI